MDRRRTSCRLTVIVLCVLGGTTVASRGQCPPHWLPGGGIPGVLGDINTATVCDLDGPGPQPPMLVVGGDFSTAGTVSARNVAAWDGTRWSNFGSGLSNDVDDVIAFDNGTGSALYAGGLSTMRKWDGSAWSSMGLGGFMAWRVGSVAWFDDGSGMKLYAGGFYVRQDPPLAYGLARWDGVSWVMSFNSAYSRLDVFDLGDGPGLYACNGSVRRWNGSAFVAVPGGSTSGVNVLALFDDGEGPALYAGGAFTTAGGAPANSIARWDGTSWSSIGDGITGGTATVEGLAVIDDGSGPALFVGGNFTSAGGLPATNLAKWDGAQWTAPEQENGGITELVTFHDEEGAPALYAVGGFPAHGGIARWTGDAWVALGHVGFNRPVEVLKTIDDGTGPALYAGGNFKTFASVAANNIARWDGATWTPLGAGPALVQNSGTHVVDITGFDDGNGFDIYACGRLDSYQSALGHVSRWNGLTWSTLGAEFNGDTNSILAFDAGAGLNLYVGGSFSRNGVVNIARIARWTGAAWVSVAGGTSGTIRTMADFNDGSGPALYVAGDFATAGGVTANSIARWNGTNWSAVGSGFLSGTARGDVQVLAVHDDGSGSALYAAGTFTSAGGVGAVNVARWNGLTWSPVGNGLGTAVQGYVVRSLRVIDDGSGPALFAAGSLWLSTDYPGEVIAKWNGVAWSALDHATSGSVYDLAGFNDAGGHAVHVGGDFFSIDGQTRNHWARWTTACALGDLNCDGGLNFLDIDPFLLALFDPTGYAAAYPDCDINYGDMNDDQHVNFLDVDPFVACLFGTCP